MDVQKREDRLLDSIATLYQRKRMTLVQLDLFEYGYPDMKPLWDDLRRCLEGDE